MGSPAAVPGGKEPGGRAPGPLGVLAAPRRVRLDSCPFVGRRDPRGGLGATQAGREARGAPLGRRAGDHGVRGSWSAPWRPCGLAGSLPPVSGPWWRPRRGMRSPHSSLCGGGSVQGAPLTAWPKTERQTRGLRRGEGGQAAPWAPWRGVLRPARWSGPPASHTRSDPCAVPGSRQDPGQAHEREGTTLDLHRAPSPQERWG